MSREHGFEMFEHTADIGVLGSGKTMAEAFENVAYGMFSIMADLDKYSPTDTAEVEADGDDHIDLLARFLSKLIVLFDADRVLPLDFKVTEIDGSRLKCEVAFRGIGDDIEWLGPQVKAVTYHQMAVDQVEGMWRARAIFDV